MKQEKVVYAVTHGDYSDYGLDGLFSTEGKAQEWIDHTFDPDYYRIEEYVLDGEQPDMSDKMFEVRIDYETFDARITERFCVNHLRAGEMVNTVRMTDSLEMMTYIVADSPVRALKVASERLSRVKAEEWRYPLLHSKCGFVGKDVACAFSGKLRECLMSRFVESRYPVYRFPTGELVETDGMTMLEFQVMEDL